MFHWTGTNTFLLAADTLQQLSTTNDQRLQTSTIDQRLQTRGRLPTHVLLVSAQQSSDLSCFRAMLCDPERVTRRGPILCIRQLESIVQSTALGIWLPCSWHSCLHQYPQETRPLRDFCSLRHSEEQSTQSVCIINTVSSRRGTERHSRGSWN